jgi:hypothetical protein
MDGLVPSIHANAAAPKEAGPWCFFLDVVFAWVAGSSPAMTERWRPCLQAPTVIPETAQRLSGTRVRDERRGAPSFVIAAEAATHDRGGGDDIATVNLVDPSPSAAGIGSGLGLRPPRNDG